MSNPIMILPIVGNHTPVKIDHHDSKQASNICSYKPGKVKVYNKNSIRCKLMYKVNWDSRTNVDNKILSTNNWPQREYWR